MQKRISQLVNLKSSAVYPRILGLYLLVTFDGADAIRLKDGTLPDEYSMVKKM